MDSLLKYRYSFAAGIFAAGGSFFGKLPSFLAAQKVLPASSLFTPEVHFYLDLILLRIIPIALMIVSNVMNWRYFLKALQLSEQTLTVTVLTAATNYMTSFLLAAVIYHEPISLLSIIGSTFIITGLWFLCDAQEQKGEKQKTS